MLKELLVAISMTVQHSPICIPPLVIGETTTRRGAVICSTDAAAIGVAEFFAGAHAGAEGSSVAALHAVLAYLHARGGYVSGGICAVIMDPVTLKIEGILWPPKDLTGVHSIIKTTPVKVVTATANGLEVFLPVDIDVLTSEQAWSRGSCNSPVRQT